MAVYRGSLGIHFNGGGEDLAAEEHDTFHYRQGLEIERYCFFDIGDCVFQTGALGLATPQARDTKRRTRARLSRSRRLPCSHVASLALVTDVHAQACIDASKRMHEPQRFTDLGAGSRF